MEYDSGMKRENRNADDTYRQQATRTEGATYVAVLYKAEAEVRIARKSSQGQRVGSEIISPRVRYTQQYRMKMHA